MSGRVQRRQHNKWAEEDQRAAAQQQEAYDQGYADAAPPPAPAPAASSSEDDRIAQLERLAALRDQGFLSDDEFAAEKAKILGA